MRAPAQFRMRPPQRDQRPVPIDQRRHPRGAPPIQQVERGRPVEGVGAAELRAGELLAGQQERQAGRGHHQARGHGVGRQHVRDVTVASAGFAADRIVRRAATDRTRRFPGHPAARAASRVIRLRRPARAHRGAQLVPQRQVVVRGDVLHQLHRVLRLAHRAVPGVHRLAHGRGERPAESVDEPGLLRVQHMPLNRVARGVAEPADAAAQPGHAALVRQDRPGFHGRVGGRPRLAVQQDPPPVRQRVDRGAHGVHGLHVDQAHQVEAEAVDVVFAGPVRHRIHNVPAEHRVFAGRVAAAAGTVGERPIVRAAAEVAGHHAFEPVVGGVHVVVDHVHDDLEPRAVQGLDHRLAFADPHLAVVGVGAVGAFGHVVVDRVVPPVELAVLGQGLVHGAVVVERQQLHAGHAEALEVVQAGGRCGIARDVGPIVREGQEPPAMFRGHPAVQVVAEVADMSLPYDQFAVGDIGAAVLAPSLGVGLGQVHDHAARAVHAGRARPGVGDAVHGAVGEGDQKVVVDARQPLRNLHMPGAARAGRHGTLGDGACARLVVGTGGEQAQRHGFGGGGPDGERRAVGGEACAQLAVVRGQRGDRINRGTLVITGLRHRNSLHDNDGTGPGQRPALPRTTVPRNGDVKERDSPVSIRMTGVGFRVCRLSP